MTKTGECSYCGKRIPLTKRGYTRKHEESGKLCLMWGAAPVTGTVLPAEGEASNA